MIGLSFSFCVRDIAEGKVALTDVEKLFAGTSATTKEDWDYIIQRYRETYWNKNRDECECIARTLLAMNKVHQPKITPIKGRLLPALYNTHWIASENEIEWV